MSQARCSKRRNKRKELQAQNALGVPTFVSLRRDSWGVGGMGRCPVKPNKGEIRARQPDRQLHFGVVQCAVHGLGRWAQNTPFWPLCAGLM
jgi:hypothetical protein